MSAFQRTLPVALLIVAAATPAADALAQPPGFVRVVNNPAPIRRWFRAPVTDVLAMVNPGVILTPFHERFTNEELMKRMVDTIALKRAGTPEETATVIAFLASSDAQYLTGETIEVNGGQLMD